jgi:hypothetical protein
MVVGHAARLICNGSRQERALTVLQGVIEFFIPEAASTPTVVVCQNRELPLAALLLERGSTGQISLGGTPLGPSDLARKARAWPGTLLSARLDETGRIGDVATLITAPFKIGEHVARSVGGWRLDPTRVGTDRLLLVVPFEPSDEDQVPLITTSCRSSGKSSPREL